MFQVPDGDVWPVAARWALQCHGSHRRSRSFGERLMPSLDISGWTPRIGEAEWPGQPLGSDVRCNHVHLECTCQKGGTTVMGRGGR